MGLVYLPTFGWFFMVNVSKYTSTMDPMGYRQLGTHIQYILLFIDQIHEKYKLGTGNIGTSSIM